MRHKHFASGALALFLSPLPVWAQDDVAPSLNGPMARHWGAMADPRPPGFKDATRILSTGRQSFDAWDGKSPTLTVDLRVAAPASGSMTDADRAEATARAIENLNHAVDRQCELYSASSNRGCKIVQRNATSQFNGRPDAQQFLNADVRAQYDLQLPETGPQ